MPVSLGEFSGLAQDLAAARSHLAQATAIVDRLVTGSSSPKNERHRWSAGLELGL